MRKVTVCRPKYGEATLQDLIEVLRDPKVAQDFRVLVRQPGDSLFEEGCGGISEPHSYRGYYERLAFAPGGTVHTVKFTLAMVRSCVGATYTGYKGGEFTMNGDTICAIAHRGYSGHPIGSIEIDVEARSVTLVCVKEVW